MTRRNSPMLNIYFPQSIDRRLQIHKHLDKNMKDKWVIVTNMNGEFGGPYLGHRHKRSTGNTFLAFWCIEVLNESGFHNPAKIIKMCCNDYNLSSNVKIIQKEGADAKKEELFGTTNLDAIKRMLDLNETSCFI